MSEQSERQERGLMIAARTKLTQKGDVWRVPSQSGYKPYYEVNPESQHCTCPDFEKREAKCKHIYAVEYTLEREQSVTQTTDGDTTTTTVTETVKVTKRVTYKQDWTAYNTAQTNEKHLLQSLLHELCNLIVEPPQDMGRPRLMYRDMLFAAAFKVYCGTSARRFSTDLNEAQIKGYVSKAAHFNSVNRYLDNPALTSLLHELIAQSALPLKALESNFAVDSSGFSTCQYVRWFDAKYGKEVDVHDWLKVHLMTGVKTHVVTSVEITGRHDHDSQQLPPLVEKTAEKFNIKEVSADKAYSSTDCHDAIVKAGGTPYIAFKSNATGAVGGVFQKMFHFYQYKRDEFLAHYHQRSNVETTFSMVKGKFGGRLRSKGDVAQTNEALCKILCHNLCCLIQSMFESGVEPNFTT
jgi:transposase/predicted nucleic acid-binding Zn finger protein